MTKAEIHLLKDKDGKEYLKLTDTRETKSLIMYVKNQKPEITIQSIANFIRGFYEYSEVDIAEINSINHKTYIPKSRL